MENVRVMKYYPYRTGFVRGATFRRATMRPLEEHLFKEAGVRIDNHTCFLVKDLYHQPVAVMFHDLQCIIGKEVEERRW